MLLQPEYCTNIIVGVTHKRRFYWFVTDKSLWFLDYEKLYKSLEHSYIEMGRSKKRFIYEVGDFAQFCEERWDISVVNNKSIDKFLDKIKKYMVNSEELGELLKNDPKNQAYYPALYVDFDRKELYSFFPEPENFQDYVPDGWNGVYEKFDALIPVRYRYWIGNKM